MSYDYSLTKRADLLQNIQYPFPLKVQDGEVSFDDHLELRALVRSGDYFATLATALDHISSKIKQQCPHEHDDLQRLVDDLLYLEHQYVIQKA